MLYKKKDKHKKVSEAENKYLELKKEPWQTMFLDVYGANCVFFFNY